MGKAKTLSSVLELPLRVEQGIWKILLARLEAGRQLYNACLGEARRRWDLVRQSKAYRAALAMPHGTEEERKARAKALSDARRAQGFSDYDLQMYALSIRHGWLGDHLDAFTAQKLGTRAFAAQERVAFGKARRARFKGKNQLDSLEGKRNATGIRWREGVVKWMGLVLPAMIDANDPVVVHGLSCRVKYVRLVRRKVAGNNPFFVQLVLEGAPYQKRNPDGSPKHPLGRGIVGLDAGPSTLAAVGNDDAILEPFCAELVPKHKGIRLLLRKLDRQRRTNNPENYNPDGTVKKGPKTWKASKGMKKTQAALGDAHRTLAAQRKSLHGNLVNRVLALGDVFLHEDVSIKGWQKRFGRSVGFRAPGRFFAELNRKAESAGGAVRAFPTRTTALSQVCHCGHRKKKPLNQRWHRCPACGALILRDLYSAYLASFVEPLVLSCGKEIWLLNAGRAENAWPGGDDLLRAAFEQLQAKTNGQSGGAFVPTSLGLKEARLLGFGSEPVAAKA
ncbi:MAG: transposase [Thermaerobacter sp.]|nr:transposase [Thermaerobacter sp.]